MEVVNLIILLLWPAVGADGSFIESSFAKGGDCERVSYTRFVRYDK